MPRSYAFNGDADGLFALQQLRLAGASADERTAALITGVKRDIALLGRVEAVAGDHCTALDISLDVNRVGLMALLEKGVQVRYFDHHFAGDIPQDAKLEAAHRSEPERLHQHPGRSVPERALQGLGRRRRLRRQLA